MWPFGQKIYRFRQRNDKIHTFNRWHRSFPLDFACRKSCQSATMKGPGHTLTTTCNETAQNATGWWIFNGLKNTLVHTEKDKKDTKDSISKKKPQRWSPTVTHPQKGLSNQSTWTGTQILSHP